MLQDLIASFFFFRILQDARRNQKSLVHDLQYRGTAEDNVDEPKHDLKGRKEEKQGEELHIEGSDAFEIPEEHNATTGQDGKRMLHL